MNIYFESNYKEVLREKLKVINSTRSSRKLSFRGLADKIGIQHTYLSRVINSEGLHFNEDQLFELCVHLEFEQEEIEYLLLVRAMATSLSEARKKILQGKIDQVRHNYKLKAQKEKFNASSLDRDISFLLDPYAILILTAFSIEEYAKKPRRLCHSLGLSSEKMKQVIYKLSELGFVEFDPETYCITKVHAPHLHYSTDHPLMRAHQQLMRNLSAAQLVKIDDSEKKSFMVTFGADRETVDKIKARFQEFLAEIEPMVVSGDVSGAYQMSFDLFKWC